MSAGRDRRSAVALRRLPGLVTLVVAVAWGAGAVAVADYVRDINSARLVGALMTVSYTHLTLPTIYSV